jgi:hypothetical protein
MSDEPNHTTKLNRQNQRKDLLVIGTGQIKVQKLGFKSSQIQYFLWVTGES